MTWEGNRFDGTTGLTVDKSVLLVAGVADLDKRAQKASLID
jgi:hypothetical protein